MVIKKHQLKLVFATGNGNKVREIEYLLTDNITLLSLNDIGCTEDIPETAATIEGNAIQKANYVTERFKYSCFADDTGLEVKALHGAPGVHSARYAGEHKNAEDNMNQLLQELKGANDRSAQFKTVICLNWEGQQFLFEGIVSGTIIESKRGTAGFGYDPIFVPNGHEKTFAEMSFEEKALLSHRGIAIQKMITFLNNI